MSNNQKMQVADHTVYQLMPDGSRNKIWFSVYVDKDSGLNDTCMAQRVAACWNACEGLTAASINDSIGVGGLHGVSQMSVRQAEKLRELNKQNKQLLTALEALILFTKPTKSNAAALANAHSAILDTKATGPTIKELQNSGDLAAIAASKGGAA